ncbi:hypothetical protein [Vibrio alfacsensis]|uniref:hypothetical protein n=1 Tax=Vibrio alfacsensis TaxID=1074311 RepID=UPI004067CEC0
MTRRHQRPDVMVWVVLAGRTIPVGLSGVFSFRTKTTSMVIQTPVNALQPFLLDARVVYDNLV